ncbi:MAG: hypothetical protein BM563_04875 [Bacteroidetes bacterium MedPE-SWsnd-G1]|nr:MAG: hypothetical protein BM563_04875 [Bacteroidetes bacterium MedPE-SWsnd-G1]
MKYLLPILAVLLLVSCKSEEKKPITPVENVPLNERPLPPLPGAGAATATNVIGGPHYICPKNCVGGNGPAAGACPVCETQMTHNQGFHTTPNTSPATPTTPNTPATTSGPNANGQWHYTCSNGCAGGGDAAGNCSNCGNALAHNAAYHS